MKLANEIKLKINSQIEFQMLSDSKIRQAGFIRNSSSRKIIYHQEPQVKNQASDDSFSSFEYESHSKVSIKSGQKSLDKKGMVRQLNISRQQNMSRQQRQRDSLLGNRQAAKPMTPQIPKPMKKHLQQPQFQNQRLKNNFFQQPNRKSQNPQRPQKPSSQSIQKLKQNLPRTNTPNFNESHIKHELQEVNNICNRIENMKLQGNFSFNPKTNNKLMKSKAIQAKLQLQSDDQRVQRSYQKKLVLPNHSNVIKSNKGEQQGMKKPKQNNYFSNTNNAGNRFQYDFGSSSSDGQKEIQSQKSQQQEQYDEGDNHDEVMRYYEEQKRQRTDPELMTRIQIKGNVSNIFGKVLNRQNPFPQNLSHSKQNQFQHQGLRQYEQNNKLPKYLVQGQIQNEESSSQLNDEGLITEYMKDDFGMKIPVYMRNKNQKLAENTAYQNMALSEPQQGMIATNGGVCFDVDVKQFSQNSSVANNPPVRRVTQNQKKKKGNEKQEMLKRRQMAKIYSKQARFRLFGFA